jgi:hypothetical protein
MPRRKGRARDDEGQSHNYENMQEEDLWAAEDEVDLVAVRMERPDESEDEW